MCRHKDCQEDFFFKLREIVSYYFVVVLLFVHSFFFFNFCLFTFDCAGSSLLQVDFLLLQ